MTTEVVLDDNREVVLTNATVTASGSAVVTSYGGKEVILVINVSGTVTGTTPTLTFTIQELDPGDEQTAIGVSASGAAITGTGVQIIEVPVSRSSFFKVSWVVTGTTPVFNAVYATLINKGAGASVLYDNLGNSVFGTAGTPGTAVLTVQGVSGGQPSPVSGTVTATQGTAAALAGAWPVEVTDGTNVLGTATHPVRTDPTGTTTQPVSGTVTSNQGTPASVANSWPTEITDGTHGPVAVKAASTAVAAADPSLAVGLSPNSPLPAGSNAIGTVAQGAPNTAANSWPVEVTDGTNVLGTAAHPVRVDPTGTTTQPVSGTVTSNQGTAAALAGAWPTEITDGTHGPVAVKAASTAAAAADPSLVVALSPNSPLPTGSNTIGALTANQSVNVAQVGGAATATAASGVQKVGVVGNAGATLDGTLAAGTAPTDGLGTLAQYNTTQPAPTNAQTLSLQSDQSGNLLTFPGTQTKTGAAWTSGTSSGTFQYPTGTTTVGAPLGGEAVLVQLDQTTTLTGGAVTFQGSYDGINFITIPTAQVLNPQTFAQLTNPYTFVASTNQPFLILLQGFQQVRLDLSTVITGTGSVTPYWTLLTATGFSAVAQGAPNTLANAWPMEITDGTHGPVAVKAASTAVAAADPSLAVGLSPNSPLPTGSNVIGTVTAQQATAGNLNATVVQGAGSGAAGTYWYVRVTDGTNTMPTMDTAARAGFQHITDGTNTAAVKAASTAAAATDPSLVVAFSPNSPLPTGSNVIGAVTQSAGPWSVSGTVTANQGTPNTTANSWPTTVTDGTHGPAAVKAASTAAAAADPSLVTAFSPNSPLPAGTNTIGVVNQGTAASVANSWTTEITDGTHGPAAVKAASTAAAAADPSLVVALSPNTPTPGVADITATGALGALNAAVTITTAGTQGVGFQLASGTLIGTIVAEVSYDGGTTWNSAYFDQNNKVASIVFGSANTAQAGSLLGEAGAGEYRVRVSAFTSGTANITLRASEISDPTVLFAGVPAAAVQPPTAAQVAGWDGANLRVLTTDTSGRQLVVGAAASGAALAGNPVLVAGSDGVDARSISTDTSGRQIVVGAAAAGAAPAGSPVLLGVVAPSGNMENVAGGSDGEVGVAIMGNDSSVHSNSTITTSGSTTITKSFYGVQQLNLIVNVTAAPTGTTPTITYTIQELDPGNGTTTMGNSASTSSITGTGVFTASLPTTTSSAIKISWTVTGTTPSFTGVYATVVSKATPSTQTTTTTSTAATPGISPGYITTTAKTNVALSASTYNEQSANFTGSVVSGSANDSSAGTGARTITITWMNSTGSTNGTESATMNGTTAVNLVTTTKCFIEKNQVATVGSTGSNVGAITIFTGAAGAGTAVAIINATDNQTFLGHHYVVSGKTCHVTDMTGETNSSNQATFTLQAVSIPVANLPSLQVSDWIVGSQTFQIQRTFSSQVLITGPARIQMFVAPGATASIQSQGSFDYFDQ